MDGKWRKKYTMNRTATKTGHVMHRYISKMAGRGNNPSTVDIKDMLTVVIGGTVTIGILLSLTGFTETLWIMAPFGASCLLVFGAWQVPYSQPRNVIGGHLLSSAIGIAVHALFGYYAWTLALAVCVSLIVVMLTKTTHPPAAANPIIIIAGGYSWQYLVTPVLIGSVAIVIMGLIINNLRSNRAYPTYWH